MSDRTLDLEDAGVRDLWFYMDGKPQAMAIGARCGRCIEVIYGRAARAFHDSKRCPLRPAVFVVVPRERDREEAIRNAMTYGRHSRADAEAIVRVTEPSDSFS